MEGKSDTNVVYVLTKSFARFSSGTQFKIKSTTGGTIAHCVSAYPMGGTEPDYIRADIPLKFLTPKRDRSR